LCADDVAELVGVVGDLEVTFVREHRDARLGRIVVEVTVSAGDRNTRAAGDYARAWDISFIDVVAQIDCEERR
jgi:hypothetical protein